MHISSSYAKILGEKLFHTWEIPRSGSKAEDGEKERGGGAKVGDNNGQAMHGARMAHASRLGQKLWIVAGQRPFFILLSINILIN